MNYTKETRINTIPNAKNILNDTIKSVQYMFDNYTLGDFINKDKKTDEESAATTTLGIFCGTGTGAMANNVKKYKGTLTEKMGQLFTLWRKDEKGADKVTTAVNNTKIEMAKNMLLAKMKPEQIATITGLSVDDVKTIRDEIDTENMIDKM